MNACNKEPLLSGVMIDVLNTDGWAVHQWVNWMECPPAHSSYHCTKRDSHPSLYWIHITAYGTIFELHWKW